jgi:hypothetical protein
MVLYPRIGIFEVQLSTTQMRRIVVFFTSYNHGVVLGAEGGNNTIHKVGHKGHDWNGRAFTPLNKRRWQLS